jgi:hypothetical protein
MKKTSMLTQLAIAGIAAGLVSAAPAHASHHGEKKDSARTEKSGCKGKGGCKGESGCKGKAGCKGDSAAALGKKVAAVAADTAKASCKGHNECKGQGGCAMSEKDLKARAEKLGIARDKAGKAHSCKGKNECKGLGGCNM